MRKYNASVDVDYVMGHLRYGHYEAVFNGAEKKEFDALDLPEDQAAMIREYGEFIVDDWEVNDTGDLDEDSITVTAVG